VAGSFVGNTGSSSGMTVYRLTGSPMWATVTLPTHYIRRRSSTFLPGLRAESETCRRRTNQSATIQAVQQVSNLWGNRLVQEILVHLPESITDTSPHRSGKSAFGIVRSNSPK
jgi:hypothetical protein